jgi:site-specific recombinase XerD
VRNRAIFWLFYDTGIRVSEMCRLRVDDIDRKHGIITIRSKGSKERRIALGKSSLSSLLHYLDQHRSDKQGQVAWENAGEDHLFLSETQTPLTENGVEMLFRRIRERAGITNKPMSPQILRHTFAIRYLSLGNDPLSLQQVLGYEDIATIKDYYVLHINDEAIQDQKRKYSPGDHLPTRMLRSRQERRRGFQVKEED